MANSVYWYGYMLRREDGHVLSSASNLGDGGQRKKGKLERTWTKQVEEGSLEKERSNKM